MPLSFSNLELLTLVSVGGRTLLRSPDVQRDVKRYREVVEKVTLYQTLGIDVSELFSDMVLV